MRLRLACRIPVGSAMPCLQGTELSSLSEDCPAACLHVQAVKACLAADRQKGSSMLTTTCCKQHAPGTRLQGMALVPFKVLALKEAYKPRQQLCNLACTSQATEPGECKPCIALVQICLYNWSQSGPWPRSCLPCKRQPRLQCLTPASLDSAGMVCQPGGGGSQ